MGTTDSRLLHSLQVAKMSSEVNSFLPPHFAHSRVPFKFFLGLRHLGLLPFYGLPPVNFFPGCLEKFVPFLYFAKAYSAFKIVE